MMEEKANYITCPKGHKVYVIWSPFHKAFGFTCDECGEHSRTAFSPMTGHVVRIKVEKKMRIMGAPGAA